MGITTVKIVSQQLLIKNQFVFSCQILLVHKNTLVVRINICLILQFDHVELLYHM